MKTTIGSFVTILAFFCAAAVTPKAHAVVPPPDGGYPGANTAEGQNALFSLTTGGFNTALGFSSLRADTTGAFNTAVGAGALFANAADSNTAIGVGALFSNTTGTQNLAEGPFALFLNTTGSFNTAGGFDTLFSNSTGQFNTAYGIGALDLNTVGNENTAFGGAALQSNTEGDNNTAIGSGALHENVTGNRNTVIGRAAGHNITSADNVICIGADLNGDNVSDSCFINNIFTATSSNGIAVLVNGFGKLGTTTSSRRFKEEIKPMNKASEDLFDLKPVSFRYKKDIDPAGTSQLGLVAEDVEKVNPNLVVRDKEGKPYSVRYDQVNAMLLNEFLKEHRKVAEQEAVIIQLKAALTKQASTIAQQQNDFETAISELRKGMQTMDARFRGQDAKIQKVSEQVELSRSTPRMVSNNQ